MTSRLAIAALAALALMTTLSTAARASAPAAVAFPGGPPVLAAAGPGDASTPASPFPTVPLELERPRAPHTGAYLVMAAGLGLVAGSFAVAGSADRTFDDYLAATDPASIERLYDRTTRLDRYASAALLGGEAVFATGVWMRFLRAPRSARVALDLRHDRCALALRF